MSTLQVNTISESTSNSGVTVDGALIKDGKIAGSAGGGLVYLGGATTGTVGSVSVNSVFSSTYLNYKIMLNVDTTNSTTTQMQMVMRASSSDTASNYIGVRQFANVGGSNVTHASSTGTAEWYIGDISSTNPNRSSADITLFKPNLAAPTNFVSNGAGSYDADWYLQQCYGVQTDSTQFDGFTILPINGSHTFVATYRVYGMVDS